MTLILSGARRDVVLDDLPGSIFELVRRLGVPSTEFKKIETSQYGTYTASTAQAEQLLKEASELERAYLREEKQRVARERNVHARDPQIRDKILEDLLEDDAWLRKIREIVVLCETVIAEGGSLVATGD